MAVSGVGTQGAEIAAQFQARVASLTKDAVEFEGQQALQLLEAASVDPAVGGNINVRV